MLYTYIDFGIIRSGEHSFELVVEKYHTIVIWVDFGKCLASGNGLNGDGDDGLRRLGQWKGRSGTMRRFTDAVVSRLAYKVLDWL